MNVRPTNLKEVNHLFSFLFLIMISRTFLLHFLCFLLYCNLFAFAFFFFPRESSDTVARNINLYNSSFIFWTIGSSLLLVPLRSIHWSLISLHLSHHRYISIRVCALHHQYIISIFLIECIIFLLISFFFSIVIIILK